MENRVHLGCLVPRFLKESQKRFRLGSVSLLWHALAKVEETLLSLGLATGSLCTE